nr:hypothetical protein [Tanacetum cinerariifolium]
MGYEHLSITPEIESDEVTESNAENLLPIPSKCEVTLEDKKECDLPISENSPVCDNHYDIFSDSKIDDDISVYDDDFEDIEYVEASLSDPENVSIEEENSVEEENVVQQEEEEIDLEGISQIQNVVLHDKLLSIIRLISNIESLNENSTLDHVFNSFESDNSLLDNFSLEFETLCDHTEETRSGNTTHANYSLSEYDSFCFEIKPGQERLINLVENDIPDNSSNDPLLEEADVFLASDNSIPPGIENFADDPEGDIHFLEELLIDDSILSHESSDSNFEDNLSIPRPPPEPPDTSAILSPNRVTIKTLVILIIHIIHQVFFAVQTMGDLMKVFNERTIPLCDIISQLPPSIVIITFPLILPTFEDPEDSLIMGNKDLITIPEKKSDEFIKSSVEDLDPIPSEFEDTSGSDSQLSPSPIPYEDSDPLLEETDILLSHFDNSLPEYEIFSFDIEEKSSGSSTTHSDYSLLNYEAFYFDDDHIKEKSSGTTTTHFDFSLPEYDSFIFNLSIDLFSPADRSVSHHEEFVDELIHIISSPEYDCFYIDTETDSGELTILFEENISEYSTKEFTSPELNDFPILLSDCDSTFSEEFSEIDLLVSFPSRYKDNVFYPGISKKTFSPTYVRLPLKDRHYLFFTYVVQDCLDLEDSHARGFVHRPLDIQSLTYRNPIS